MQCQLTLVSHRKMHALLIYAYLIKLLDTSKVHFSFVQYEQYKHQSTQISQKNLHSMDNIIRCKLWLPKYFLYTVTFLLFALNIKTNDSFVQAHSQQ